MRPLLTLLLTLPAAANAQTSFALQDRSAVLGLHFTHDHGGRGEYWFPEITGAGVGLVDFDNDGDLDIYLVQSGSFDGSGPGDQLFRNDLGRARWRFEDITEQAGIDQRGYGMGIAAGDIDNDGWIDLYLSNYGANVVLKNNGKGGFFDVTDKAAANDPRWSTSASFFDFNRDGWLDLYVANYVQFSGQQNPKCYANTSRRDYCGPATFTAETDRLFINQGGGHFSDRSGPLLGPYTAGPSLGVVAADLNDDGWQDLYVANDGQHNHLWLNQEGQKLIDDALFAGAAVNGSGVAEASMGVAIGDYDDDGDEDIFLTHLMGETNTLYQNDGKAQFSDVTAGAGLAGVSRNYTGWGTLWADLDGNGWLDLAVFNGAVRAIESQRQRQQPYPFKLPNQVFLNHGPKGFVDASQQAGPAIAESHSSRGAAFGDLDNDGDLDIVVNNSNGPAQVLINNGAEPAGWLGLRVMDRAGGRDAYGAKVIVTHADGRRQTRRVAADGSYASSNDPRVLFYYSKEPPQEIQVQWPDGSNSKHDIPQSNRYTTITQPDH